MANKNSRYIIDGQFKGVESIVAGFGRISDAASRTGKRLHDSARQSELAWRRQETALSKLHAGYSRIDSLFVDTSGIWARQAQSIHKYTDASMRLLSVQQKLQMINLKPEDHATALKGIQQTVASLRGLTLKDTTESFIDLYSSLGDVKEALEFLPIASKYKFNTKALFGEKFSAEDIDRQILGAFKFMEQTGVMRATGAHGSDGKRAYTDEDKKRAEEYFNIIAKMTASTGGRITGQTLLPLAGRGGMSMMGLTPQGLKNLAFMVEEMGGPQTGTALMSAFRQFVGGSMEVSKLRNLDKLGLVDRKKVQYSKAGLITKAQPGAVPIGDLLQKDPLLFADTLANTLKDKKGINPDDINAVTKEIANLVGNRTASNLIAKMIVMRDQIKKNADLVDQAKAINEGYSQSLDSIAGRIEELKAAQENFQAGLGNVYTTALGSLAKSWQPAIKAASDYFAMNPEAAKFAGYMLLGAKGLSAMAQTMMVMKLSGITGMFSRGKSPLVAPPLDLDPRTQWDNLFRKNAPVAQAGARSAGVGIGTSLGAGFAIGVALFGLEQVITSHLKNKELDEAAKDAGRRTAESYTEGLTVDISGKTKEEQIAIIEEERRRKEAQRGQDHVAEMKLQHGRRDMGFLGNWLGIGDRPADTILALRAAQSGYLGTYQGAGKARTREMLSAQAGMSVGDRTDKSVIQQAGAGVVENIFRSYNISSLGEFIATLRNAKSALEAGGEADLFGKFQQILGQAYPELKAQYDAEIAARRLQVEALGYDADTLQSHASAVVRATGVINSAAGGQPEPPPEKKATGGMVLSPTRILAGENGPEWVSSFRETKKMFSRSMGPISLSAPINLAIHGNVSAADGVIIRHQAQAGFRAAGEEILQSVERMIVDQLAAD